MDRYPECERALRANPRRWCVTGAAGFIGGHLVDRLLDLGQPVTALDNFASGSRAQVEAQAARAQSARTPFRLDTADIREPSACAAAIGGAAVVVHFAALSSVPRSLEDPGLTHAVNCDGFVNILGAVRSAGRPRLVYASSSSVYGDDATLPKVEGREGVVLSPYAASKRTNEAYAAAFAAGYGLGAIGLRFFNIFGPRQDPNGAYAAVIPRWFLALRDGAPAELHGDGGTTRDFCFVENAVRATLLAGWDATPARPGAVYNIGCGATTTLAALFAGIRERVARKRPAAATAEPRRLPSRPGDIRHSVADISLATAELGFVASHPVAAGLDLTAAWYLR